MSASNWRDAVKALTEAIEPISPTQKKIAVLAGVSISDTTPRIVSAAKLRLALSRELHLRGPLEARDDSVEWIARLWPGPNPPISPDTQEEANAWIEYLFLLRRRASLLELCPNEGDIVATPDGVYAEVSSIGENGRLYFKGGGGFGAWPDQVSVVARVDDESDSAANARTHARNAASSRRSASSWSSARQQDLIEFQVKEYVTSVEISQLETVIDSAEDERPIQRHLEANPHLLTILLQRSERYLLPQKRLGSEFVPDFIVGDVDSMGINWLLVELETPNAPLYLKDEKTLSAQTRKGIDQVIQWRDWLIANVAYARQPRRENGLGLFDIRGDARALVLVGRRSLLLRKSDAARHELRESSNIHVHTYDWLLESIRGAMEFSGPSALNPYAFGRDVS